MEQHGANSCKKVNGVDTCFCGDSRECDPHKKKKLCLNGQGKKIKGDTEAKCRKGICKFFSRNSTCLIDFDLDKVVGNCTIIIFRM